MATHQLPDPADLVEAWHLVLADGAEPVRWKIPRTLWERIRQAAEDNGQLVEDASCRDRALLGSPVEIATTDDHAPILFVRRGGIEEAVPILGPLLDC